MPSVDGWNKEVFQDDQPPPQPSHAAELKLEMDA